MKIITKTLFTFFVFCIFGASFNAVYAEKNIKGEALVILAKEAEGEKDPQLKNISALSKPPFNAFKTMKVLSTSAIQLNQGKSTAVDLPNKSKLHIQLHEILKDSRFKVDVSIHEKEGKKFLPLLQVKASAGKHFFVAGQKFKDGTLIIGIKIDESKASK